MVNFVGHTMAVPGMDMKDAIKTFSEIGLNGIEIVTQEGTPFTPSEEKGKIDGIIEIAKNSRLEIVTLTPYYWDINNADSAIAEKNIDGMKKAVDLARYMGAGFVRAYGGKENAGGTKEENWKAAVCALREIGSFAKGYGITVLVENHPGTMTRTGKATREMIDQVGQDNVKALYDPANVMHDTDENWEYTYDVQKEVIGYVHLKDFLIREGKRSACILGQGIVPWDKILPKFKYFDGYMSFEYEKRWYPEQLEDANIGVRACLEYVRKVII